MATKKKTSRSGKPKKTAAKVSWTDTIKQALEKKKGSSTAWPDQGKPRDTTVQKVKKDAF